MVERRRVMPEYDVVCENLCKNFGDFEAVKNFNLKVEKGEYIAFLGPSGCGKSTTLRCIAGHNDITSGEVLLRGERVNDLPPGQRDTSMMFQNFALFPHKTVNDNVGFGLKMRGIPINDRRKRVEKMLEIVGLEGMGRRKPGELSGGQQQRVALARALITEPAVLLLDEPLGHLDELLRIKLRGELKNLQRKLGITSIHVTHNQDECLTMGDRLVVMNEGIIEQIGTPQDIYIRPATFFVATFVGDNFVLRGEIESVDDTLVGLKTAIGTFKINTQRKLPQKGEDVGFSIRADLIHVLRDGQKSDNQLNGIVEFVEYVGYVVKVRTRIESGDEIIIKQTQDEYFETPPKEGDQIKLGWAADEAILLTGPYTVVGKSIYGE
jgi:putative spermidine/putrescine transport system ATP-binding protein